MKKTISNKCLSFCELSIFTPALLSNLGSGFITVVWVFIFFPGPVGHVFTL